MQKQTNPGKLAWLDTLPGFGLKIFGGIWVANLLSLLLWIATFLLVELLGEFLVQFVFTGMSLLILYVYTYSVAWNKGFRDIGLASRNLTTYSPYRGALAGLIAIIPYILSAVSVMVSAYALPQTLNVTKGIYKILCLPMVYLTEGLLSRGAAWALVVPFLVLPLVTTLAYRLGYQNRLLSKIIMYRKDDETGDETDGKKE